MNLAETLAVVARYQPDRPALTVLEGDRPRAAMTYGELIRAAARIGGLLSERMGLRAGDRVALFMENRTEFYPLMFGCWRAGLSVVPINAKLHGKEVAWILEDSGAKVAFTSAKAGARLTSEADGAPLPHIVAADDLSFAAEFAGEAIAQVESSPSDEAWLFYTSGTTGRPKGARLSHRSLFFMVHAYLADIDFLGPNDTHVHPAPLTHGSGLYGLACFMKGGNNVILPGFEADEILSTIEIFSDVSFFAAPTMITRLLAHPRIGTSDLANLKTITYGGAPMYAADLERAIATFGPRLYQLYGQGESPMTITGVSKAIHADFDHPERDARLSSCGVARTGVAVRVVDEAGNDLPAGEVGEVVTKSDALMLGYLNSPEANAAAIRNSWLWTGDLGCLDAAGFLTLKDRSKDLIISGGTNIYPREIEEVLLTHPAVAECAVTGRPHPDWGEEVVAFVVAVTGATPTAGELDELCLKNIARFKRPKDYRFVTELPKNNYGKILKTELRKQLAPRED